RPIRGAGAPRLPKPPPPNINPPGNLSSSRDGEGGRGEPARLLRPSRLVTVPGSGGRGKTRLALHAAAAELDQFPDGVWFIELAPLVDAELVVETIAKVLRTPKADEQDPLAQLGAVLDDRHLLLMLDNCEHLLDECARVATYLL